ncbi:hypothetical protein OGAPHI_002972 [Ogataea philodendri]|uniref:Mitochondrial carrier protein n=1 Tax=Ogataea philodendri TaxID=1378263 RepID=A0A9P8T5S7_9ASCO|nr:uncharacterized protein OGAPHI_002972 [Ogataea philodendri]KAH3667323.1 hypothetical protein OGAPHI_002972 [Ogataea philodendri]
MNEFTISLVSGGAAGTATDLAFFPIDTIKTRLQAHGGFLHNGGFRGLYRGLASAVVASAPSAALFFVTYDTLKRQLLSTNTPAAVCHMISASCGEIAACLVRVPAEVIKQRTQSLKFNTSAQALRHILGNKSGEGVLRGLYRGWSTTIMREIPFTIIQFPLYEYLKSLWSQDTVLSPAKGAVCGSVAGGVAAAATTPLDLLKTRLMLSEGKVGVWSLAKSIAQNEGSTPDSPTSSFESTSPTCRKISVSISPASTHLRTNSSTVAAWKPEIWSGLSLKNRATSSSLHSGTKFAVKATESSRLITMCHHPAGTCIHSPGNVIPMVQRGSSRAILSVSLKNPDNTHSASPSGDVTSLSSSFVCTPGGVTCGGSMIHSLDPSSTVFHADVLLGSLWNVEPDRCGPMISHVWSGRHERPWRVNTSNMSSENTAGLANSFFSCCMASELQSNR